MQNRSPTYFLSNMEMFTNQHLEKFTSVTDATLITDYVKMIINVP